MEKIKALFQSEKVKGFSKRVFNKKTIIGALMIIVVVIALRIAFSLIFQVEGVVSKVEGSNITVVNFLTTKTVDVGSFQTASSNIQVGDRIEIMKNISGDVISVRDESKRGYDMKGNSNNQGRNNFKGKGEKNLMRRR